jgi:hypothetical protein
MCNIKFSRHDSNIRSIFDSNSLYTLDTHSLTHTLAQIERYRGGVHLYS